MWTPISYTTPISKQMTFLNEIAAGAFERLDRVVGPLFPLQEAQAGDLITSSMSTLLRYARRCIEYCCQFYVDEDGDNYTLSSLLSDAGYGSEWVTGSLKSDPLPWLQLRSAIDKLSTLKRELDIEDIYDWVTREHTYLRSDSSHCADIDTAWAGALGATPSSASFSGPPPADQGTSVSILSMSIVLLSPGGVGRPSGYYAAINTDSVITVDLSSLSDEITPHKELWVGLSVILWSYPMQTQTIDLDLTIGGVGYTITPTTWEIVEVVVDSGELDGTDYKIPVSWDEIPADCPFTPFAFWDIDYRRAGAHLQDPLVVYWKPEFTYGSE